MSMRPAMVSMMLELLFLGFLLAEFGHGRPVQINAVITQPNTINNKTSQHGHQQGNRRVLLDQLQSLHKQAVKSIESTDGDIIDCIPANNQPALNHPLLKDHEIQSFPSSFPSSTRRKKKMAKRRIRRSIAVPQVWHGSGRCPAGTIPVRRTSEQDLARWENQATSYGTKIHKPARTPKSAATASADTQSEVTVSVQAGNDYEGSEQTMSIGSSSKHEHAIAYVEGGELYGASAVLSVWDPWVEASNEFSLSQLWILGGSFDGDLNSIEAGWQVSPELYGDGRPRLFIYWTTDGYETTGCYNLLCSGFVQTSDTVAIGASIAPISNFGGSQYQIEIMIWKDPRQGNWWMAFEGTHIVGYWPAELFSHLSDHASMVEWGGEIVNSRPNGHHTGTQMGSGRFADDGFGYASFFHSLQVVDAYNNLQAITNVQTLAENSNCYDIRSMEDPNWGASFYYGGPGRNSLCP